MGWAGVFVFLGGLAAIAVLLNYALEITRRYEDAQESDPDHNESP